ncbi:hypothetical protein [Nocardia alni]|uniref:hypothetical protein n=1 Tax=Nocardia alni TaxID=2815723 RepID=UPI001C2178B7|nr:hypothetical protein [Nocardia alni]
MWVAEKVIAAYEDSTVLARLDRGNDNAGRIAELEKRIETTAEIWTPRPTAALKSCPAHAMNTTCA